VLDAFRSIAQLLLRDSREGSHNVTINVAIVCDTSGIAILCKRTKVIIASDMQAEDCKVDSVIGTENATIAFRARSYCQTRRAYHKGIEKFTSVHHSVAPDRCIFS